MEQPPVQTQRHRQESLDGIDYGTRPKDFLDRVGGTCGQNRGRMWGQNMWKQSRQQALAWFEEYGIPGRASRLLTELAGAENERRIMLC